MAQQITEPPWLQAEREYEDDLEEYRTIPELYETSAAKYLDDDAQLYKGGVYDRSMAGVVPEAPDGEYAALTYRQMRDIVRNLAAGFREAGLERGDRVGILANTRMEWGQADLGLLAAGCVVTTVYTDSSPSQVEYLLGDPGARGVIVENETLLDRVLEVEDELDLEFIVLIDEPSSAYGREDIYTLRDIHDTGAEVFDEETYRGWLDETDPDDLASLIYTSGTTGRPKGVRLTHWNFRSNFHAVRKRAGPREDEPGRVSIDENTTTISFLPLAHVFERLSGHFLIFGSGGTVGYAESTDTIAEDINQLKPNGGGSVPRVYERIFASMREEASASPVKKRIFNWALDVAKQYQMADNPGTILSLKHSVADSLVYSSIREELGGEIEIFVSGGGSLSVDLCRIFNGIGLTIVEGYGLTETAPVVSVNSPEDIRPGTVGVPLVNVDVAIDESQGSKSEVDLHNPNSTLGELLVRGPNVTDGYWNKPGATDRAFVADPFDAEDSEVTAPGEMVADGSGKWFRTGDLVERTPESFLVIHDRLKQLIVLDTGKNVAPQPIEDKFSTDERVEQIMVIGDDEKFIAALVVPNFEALDEWAADNGIDLPDSRAEQITDERVNAWIGDRIEEVNTELAKHETIKKFALVAEEWTPENDLLTPSMKKKRRDITSTHDDKIAEIYED
jgi:long-chain acyl-CoA synthetase